MMLPSVAGIAGFVYLWFPQVLFAVKVHDKHVSGLHELFLHPARRNVYLVFMAYTRSAACACHLGAQFPMLAVALIQKKKSTTLRPHDSGRGISSYPAQVVELCAERANVVCRMIWIRRVHECLGILLV